MTTLTQFGATHFGAADLGHKKRTECLVKIADLIYRHPGGTLPHKLHAPKDYKAMDRLMNRVEVTHASVLKPHCAHTRERMTQQDGPVLVLADKTVWTSSAIRRWLSRSFGFLVERGKFNPARLRELQDYGKAA